MKLKAIMPHKASTDTFSALQQALQLLITTPKLLRQAIRLQKASKISEACGAESSIRSASVHNMAGIQLALIPKLSWKSQRFSDYRAPPRALG